MKFIGLLVLIFLALPAHAAVTYTDVYRGVNNERISRGLPALRHSNTLDKVAQDRLNDMVSKGYFAHRSPTGQDEWTWYGKEDYDYKEAGENLAKDFNTAENTVKGWMDSLTHRQNILNPKYTETGIATNGTITVQEFGETRYEYFKNLRKP